MYEQLGLPDLPALRRRGDDQRGLLTVSSQHGAVILMGPEVHRRSIRQLPGHQVVAQHPDLLHLHVLHRDGGAGRGIAHRKLQHQAGVLACHLVHHRPGLGGGGKAVQGAHALLGAAVVVAQLVAEFPCGGHVGADAVGLVSLQRHACIHKQLHSPHLAALVGGGDDVQRGAVLALVEGGGVLRHVPFIHVVHAVVGKALHLHGLIAAGHSLGFRPRFHAGVHGKAHRQHIGVMLMHLLHPDVVHGDLAAVGGLAEGELQNHLAALAAGAAQVDELLEGALGHIAHALAVEGAVALLVVAVVEADLHVHLVGGGHVGADPVQGARLQNGGGLHVQPGHPHLGAEGDLLHLHGDAVQMAVQLIEIARVVLHVHRALRAPGNGHGHHALVVGLGLQLLHLNAGEVDGKGLQGAQLQIQIGIAVAGADLPGDAVLTLADGELVEVAELHRACHVGVEVVGHPVVTAGHGHIVALQLHVPGLAVGLGGGKAIHAVHRLALTGHIAALKLGPEHVGRLVGEDQRLRRRVLLLRLHHHGGGVLRLVHHSGRLAALAAGGQQQGQQQENGNDPSRAFHHTLLLAKMVIPAEIRRRKRQSPGPFPGIVQNGNIFHK